MKHVKLFSRLITILSVCLVLIFSVINVAGAGVPVQKTVDGTGLYFVTGESYPTNIVIAGYDTRTKNMYLNIDMETTLTVNNTAKFNYYVHVYDNSSAQIDKPDDDATPKTADSASGTKTVSVKGEVVGLSTDLTTAYRIVVTVDHVALN